VRDRCLQAGVSGFDMDCVVHVSLDAERGHLVGDPLRGSSRRDSRVGDDQDPAGPILGQIEPDLLGGPGAEFELRRPVGEDRLGVCRHGQASSHAVSPSHA
jgi:hypothetical protein